MVNPLTVHSNLQAHGILGMWFLAHLQDFSRNFLGNVVYFKCVFYPITSWWEQKFNWIPLVFWSPCQIFILVVASYELGSIIWDAVASVLWRKAKETRIFCKVYDWKRTIGLMKKGGGIDEKFSQVMTESVWDECVPRCKWLYKHYDRMTIRWNSNYLKLQKAHGKWKVKWMQ